MADKLKSQYVVSRQELRRKSQASAEGILNIGGFRWNGQAGDQSAIQQYIEMAELCQQARRKGVVEIEFCLLRNLCLRQSEGNASAGIDTAKFDCIRHA